MTPATPSTAIAVPDPVFTDPERLALAGFLAGYRGLTRNAYAVDLRQFVAWKSPRACEPTSAWPRSRAKEATALQLTSTASTARSCLCFRSPSTRNVLAMRTTRLRVTMNEVEPTVQRVMDVPAGAVLPELHDLFQVAIGWTDSHLHQFVADDARYGMPGTDADDDERDETGVALRALPDRFSYLYDFGDGWEHEVEVVGPAATGPASWPARAPALQKTSAGPMAMPSSERPMPTPVTRSTTRCGLGQERGTTASTWRLPTCSSNRPWARCRHPFSSCSA